MTKEVAIQEVNKATEMLAAKLDAADCTIGETGYWRICSKRSDTDATARVQVGVDFSRPFLSGHTPAGIEVVVDGCYDIIRKQSYKAKTADALNWPKILQRIISVAEAESSRRKAARAAMEQRAAAEMAQNTEGVPEADFDHGWRAKRNPEGTYSVRIGGTYSLAQTRALYALLEKYQP